MLRHARGLGRDPLDHRAASRNVYFAVNKVGRGFVVVIVFETSEFLQNSEVYQGQAVMADNAIVKIMTSLLKHQVKKLVGEETLGVISEELADIGGKFITRFT